MEGAGRGGFPRCWLEDKNQLSTFPGFLGRTRAGPRPVGGRVEELGDQGNTRALSQKGHFPPLQPGPRVGQAASPALPPRQGQGAGSSTAGMKG